MMSLGTPDYVLKFPWQMIVHLCYHNLRIYRTVLDEEYKSYR